MNKRKFTKRTIGETVTLLCRAYDPPLIDGYGKVLQKELERLSGVGQPTISRALSRFNRSMTDNNAQKLAKFFKVSTAQLRGEEPIDWIDDSPNQVKSETLRKIGEETADFTQTELAELLLQIDIIKKRKNGEISFPPQESESPANRK